MELIKKDKDRLEEMLNAKNLLINANLDNIALLKN
jgi:hypothetical protein